MKLGLLHELFRLFSKKNFQIYMQFDLNIVFKHIYIRYISKTLVRYIGTDYDWALASYEKLL